MDAVTKMAMGIRANKKQFRRLLNDTLQTIESWLSKSKNPYVAFSGGKDSSVLLHLVRAVNPSVAAMFSDDEYLLPETKMLVGRTPNLKKIASNVRHTDWFWSWQNTNSLPSDTEWIETTNDAATEWAHRNGYDGVAVGLRSEENSYRKMAIKRYGELFFVQSKKLWQCWPLAWWTVEDIWSAIVSMNIPYNAAYDKMDEMGISLDRQRIGPYANWRGVTQGQLTILKRGWPAEFSRFAKNHPEAMEWV